MFPRLEITTASEAPLYRQVYAQIRTLIESGRLERGERLPATRELAGLLGLNRATISAAYQLLESEGLIHGHVGRGSFVDGEPRVSPTSLDWEALVQPTAAAVSNPAGALAVSGDVISFASSRPAENLFPLEPFRTSCREVLGGRQARGILQLGSPKGYRPLRSYLLEHARQEGVARSADDLVITSGCQQALDLIQRVLIGPGDAVVIEEPVYHGVQQVFGGAGARLIGVPVGPAGMMVEPLLNLLNREKPKLLVLTPNFQNPTGTTLELAARRAILRAAKEGGVVLVENDIYGDLRYRGEPIPSLKQLDESGDVIMLRSFSKIAFPGLRVGWVIAPQALTARLAGAKQWCDLHTDQLSQAVLLRFAESGRLEAHRKRVLQAGAERLTAALAACAEHLPPGSRYTRPEGGMNLWVELPEPLDAGELLARAQRENVTYLPGKYFAVSRPVSGSLRLSFAGLTPERIHAGVAALGRIFSEELERVRAASGLEPAPAMV